MIKKPRPQNKNGRMFRDYLEHNPHLTIVNALPSCEGLITRRRLRNGEIEESVLDLFVVCSKVLPFVQRMVIDESKDYILTNYRQVGKTGKAVDSDHFTEYMDLDIRVEHEKPESVEIFNFNEGESKEKFKTITSDTNDFTQCFENEKPLFEQIENWQHTLKTFCKKSFKMMRIKKKSVKPLKQSLKMLIQERKALIKQNDTVDKETKIKYVSNKIFELEAEEN
jgi:hypothetical protein